MTRKFTKEELEAAYKQVQEEHIEAEQKAKRMLEWTLTQLGFGPRDGHLRYAQDWMGYSCAASFYSEPVFDFVLVHQTYGPYIINFTDALDKMPWAKKSVKFADRYEVTTPEGEYQLLFEYFDNHCCGY